MANTDRIKALYQRAGEAYREGKALLDQHEGRDVPADVAGQVDKLFSEAEQKQKEARLLERHDGLDRELNAVDELKRLGTPTRLETTASGGAAGGGAAGGGLDRQSAEAKAFELYLRMGNSAPAEVKAALNIGTDAQGGYLTPTAYYNEIVKAMYDQSILRMAGARVIPLMTDSTEVPTLSATAAAVLSSEAAAYDEKEPTTGAVAFTPFKYTRLAKASDEVVADSRFPLWDVILAPDFAQAFALAENAAFTVGTGAGQPQGVVTGSSAGVVLPNGSTQVTTISSADSIFDLYHALDYKYRPRAKWMLNDATLKILRKFKDSTGQYIWMPGLAPGQPDSIMNRPVIGNPAMDAPAASKKTILFGDFSYFWIGDREGLQVKALLELYSGTGQIGFRAYKRFDSHVMLGAAIVHLQQAAS